MLSDQARFRTIQDPEVSLLAVGMRAQFLVKPNDPVFTSDGKSQKEAFDTGYGLLTVNERAQEGRVITSKKSAILWLEMLSVISSSSCSSAFLG